MKKWHCRTPRSNTTYRAGYLCSCTQIQQQQGHIRRHEFVHNLPHYVVRVLDSGFAMSTQNIRYRLCGVVSNGRVLVNSKKPQETRNLCHTHDIILFIILGTGKKDELTQQSNGRSSYFHTVMSWDLVGRNDLTQHGTCIRGRQKCGMTYLCSSVGVRVLIFENVRVLLLRVMGYARTPRTRRPKSRTRRCMFTTAILRFNNVAKHFRSEEFRIIFDSDVTCVLVPEFEREARVEYSYSSGSFANE